MNTLQQLCRDIGLAQEVTEIVVNLDSTMVFPDLSKLRQEGQWKQGLQETKVALGEDSDGFKMLTCMLRCALECFKDYQLLGIPEQIFTDTMACFSRFVNEHMVSFRRYGFDRDFWTVRQVSAKLFRIGQLEYELLVEGGKKVVSLHIPSDTKLHTPLLRQSWEDARTLISRVFPDFAEVPFVCGSWLLSPNLRDLLPATSNILKFQESFTITSTFADQEFKEWVYKRTDIPNADLPEDTALQRSLKTFLLSGGTFFSGEGTLIDEPFQ